AGGDVGDECRERRGFPDPVGPPTSTSPRGRRASTPTSCVKPSSVRAGKRIGSARMAAAARPRSWCTFIRNRPSAGSLNARSTLSDPDIVGAGGDRQAAPPALDVVAVQNLIRG